MMKNKKTSISRTDKHCFINLRRRGPSSSRILGRLESKDGRACKKNRKEQSLSRCARNKKNGKRTRSNVFEAGRSRNEGK